MNVFDLDNHVSDSMEFIPISTENEVFISKLISEFYSKSLSDPCNSLLEITGTNINSGNFKIGNIYIKSICLNKKKDYVYNFPNIAQKLKDAGIPVNPFIFNDKEECISTLWYQDASFACYSQPFMKADFFSGSENQFVATLGMIEKLKTVHLEEKESSLSPFRGWDPESVVNEVENALAEKSDQDEFDKLARYAIELVRKSLTDYNDTLQELVQFKGELNHYDLHPHNLLYQGDFLAAVIDFESFVVVPKRHCEAFCLFKLARKSISKKIMSPGKVKKIFREFSVEGEILLPYISLELTRRICTILNLNYISGVTDWNGDLKKHLAGFEEARIIFS